MSNSESNSTQKKQMSQIQLIFNWTSKSNQSNLINLFFKFWSTFWQKFSFFCVRLKNKSNAFFYIKFEKSCSSRTCVRDWFFIDFKSFSSNFVQCSTGNDLTGWCNRSTSASENWGGTLLSCDPGPVFYARKVAKFRTNEKIWKNEFDPLHFST